MRIVVVVVASGGVVLGLGWLCVWLAARRYRRYLSEAPVTARWLHEQTYDKEGDRS
jgi:hypothetical protein